MNIKLGFIGTGNMGSALIKGIIKAKILDSQTIYAFDTDTSKLKGLAEQSGINICTNCSELVEKCDYIILCVKPNMVKTVLLGCKSSFTNDKILISIAVGVPISAFKDLLGVNKKIVRTMPNTPALVGEGMTLVSCDENINDEEKYNVLEIFKSVGLAELLDEKLMNEVTAVTGSSPAYVYMFIEAMADAAVLSGIPRALSYKLAAQAVLGSAKMVLDTGIHPGELKDQVCSPGGTTIEAVSTFEKHAFRFAIMDAMNECTKKARDISSKYSK